MNPHYRDWIIGTAIGSATKVVLKTALVTGTVLAILSVWNPTKAQTPGHHEMHWWYKNLWNPTYTHYESSEHALGGKGMCCNERIVKETGEIDGDCSPAVIWQDPDNPKIWWGRVEYLKDPVSFTEDKFVHDPNHPERLIDSPDGRAHICIEQQYHEAVYCAVQGKPKG